jgi:SAM-dependent methyltransferase
VEKTLSLEEAALAWWRDLLRREGLMRGGWSAMKAAGELALDYLPSRKRLRFGDIDYDFDHGVNTTWANPSLAVRLRETFTRGKYQPSEPGLFHRILNELKIRYEEFTFIDLGSGKGRTLLMASEYAFRKIVGAEIIPELHAIAAENVRRYTNERQKCFAIETWLGDAREFPLPDGPLVIYLFNPFPADVLREVLRRIRFSFVENPREIYVIYHNLVHEDVFRDPAFLQTMLGTDQFAIYRVQEPTQREFCD